MNMPQVTSSSLHDPSTPAVVRPADTAGRDGPATPHQVAAQLQTGGFFWLGLEAPDNDELAEFSQSLQVTAGPVIRLGHASARSSFATVADSVQAVLPTAVDTKPTASWRCVRQVVEFADSGYVSEDNFARADTDGLRLLAPLAKDPARRHQRTPQRARHLDRLPATARATRRLRHPRGRDDYKLRARTVEPVFGQLKTCQKLTVMSRRGLPACENEWLLACAAHNLRKLHRYRAES
jgi:hypothetical protein